MAIAIAGAAWPDCDYPLSMGIGQPPGFDPARSRQMAGFLARHGRSQFQQNQGSPAMGLQSPNIKKNK